MALCTRLFQRSSPISLRVGLAQLVVVGLALAEGLVGDLEVGHELALVEEPGPEAGAEGDDQLESLAPDHGRALDVGVVGHLGRQAERLGQRRRPGRTPTTAWPGRGRRGCPGRAWSRSAGPTARARPAPCPGKPTEARSAVGSGRHQPGEHASPACRGAAGRWSGTRTRSATMAPSASSTDALSPVPPMSTARVKGCAGLGLGRVGPDVPMALLSSVALGGWSGLMPPR